MKRIFVLVVIFLIFGSTVAYAHHNQPPTLPLVLDPAAVPVLKDLYADGEMTVALDKALWNNADFKRDVSVSNANYAKHGFFMRLLDPVGFNSLGEPLYAETPDVRFMAPADAIFIDLCSAGAAGCIMYWSPLSVPIYVRASLGYSIWLSVIAHELGHAWGMHEQYNDQKFACYPQGAQFPTMMQCGRFPEGYEPQAFDVEVIFKIITPDMARDNYAWVESGYLWLAFSDFRADNGANRWGFRGLRSNTERGAVFFSDNGGPWQFLGDWCPAQFNYCYMPAPAQGGYSVRGFELSYWCPRGVNRVWGIRPENAASWWVTYPSGFAAVAGACPALDIADQTAPLEDTTARAGPKPKSQSVPWREAGYAFGVGVASGVGWYLGRRPSKKR